MSTPNRIPALDGLRAFSIVCVLLAHLSGTRHFIHSDVLELYGNFGVRVFFVISGYLITSLLVREYKRTGSISLRSFYVRRAFRIFPAAYAFMLIAIATHWRELSCNNIAAALSYTSNYFHGGHWSLGHLWSLSVEEQFYLLWPLMLLLFFRSRLWITRALILAGPPFRILFWVLWGRRGLEHPFPVVMDALAAGCMLAMLQPELTLFERWIRSRWFLMMPAFTTLLPLVQIWSSRWYQVVGLTLLHIGIALSIPHTMLMQYRALAIEPVTLAGAISYSLYLWQQPFLNRASLEWWAAFPVNIAFAVACATASYYAIEQPFLRLRDRGRNRKSNLAVMLPAGSKSAHAPSSIASGT